MKKQGFGRAIVYAILFVLAIGTLIGIIALPSVFLSKEASIVVYTIFTVILVIFTIAIFIYAGWNDNGNHSGGGF